MTSTSLRWSGLGLTALALGACTPEAAAPGPAPASQTAGDAAVATPLAGAETVALPAGEGEGGVDAARAASDAVSYLAGLAVAEAHAHAALAAFEAGDRQAAASMFAHPVGEVLFDFEPVFQALGVAPFDAVFTQASATASDPASDTQAVRQRTQAVLDALSAAAAKAPADRRAPETLALRVIADMSDRAARQYANALASGEYEPYLDGYGFRMAIEARSSTLGAALRARHPEVEPLVQEVLAQLRRAFPSAVQPEPGNRIDMQTLAVANARLQLSVGGL